MAVFDKNIEHLGSLHAVLLDHIAAFYSFLKASRDATGALANWNDAYPTRRKLDDIVDIIYLCFLTMMHGHHAVSPVRDLRPSLQSHPPPFCIVTKASPWYSAGKLLTR